MADNKRKSQTEEEKRRLAYPV